MEDVVWQNLREEIERAGWGEMTIIFRDGKPEMIKIITQSISLRKNKPKSEEDAPQVTPLC